MKNNFAAEYEMKQDLTRRFNLAQEAGDEEAKAAIRNEYKTLMASIEEKGSDYAELFTRFADAKERGNERIDLSDVIWDNQIPGLMESFRKMGIEEFTFSSTWSSAVETAWLFTKNGYQLAGLIEINSRSKDFFTGEYAKAPAYLFKAN